MIAFVTLHYAFYPLALIVFGLLLRTGVLNGENSVELTIIPAAVAGILLVIGASITLIPGDLGEVEPLADRRRVAEARDVERDHVAREQPDDVAPDLTRRRQTVDQHEGISHDMRPPAS